MKKYVRIMAVALALLMVTLAFASCGNKLSGTYVRDGLFSDTELKFSGDNVTITKGKVEVKGTYEIKDDKINIKLEESEDDSLWESIGKEFINALVGEQSFEKTDDGIKIGIIEYKKK